MGTLDGRDKRGNGVNMQQYELAPGRRGQLGVQIWTERES